MTATTYPNLRRDLSAAEAHTSAGGLHAASPADTAPTTSGAER